ncbi:MAG: M16 family metallopeptidase [Acidobacteriota bacterium]
MKSRNASPTDSNAPSRPDSAPRGETAPQLEFEKVTLANGLDLILHEDRKLPVVHVNLWYHVGSKNERPGKTGFAHLFEHMMFEGSKNVKGEYVSLMEKAGANIAQGGVNGTTDFDRTNYFETVPSGSLELVLWAESDRMGYLLDALTQENLDNQREVVKNERRQSMDNVPYGRAVEVIFENLFPEGHPYSWHIIGSMEDLTRASVDDVKEFFRTYYTPNNCTLTIAGDFDPVEARRFVETYFAPLPPGPPLVRPGRHVVTLQSERRLVVRDRVPQERLYLAWPGIPYFEKDDAALDLLSRVLSEGKNSRLYKRLVYDEQLASDVNVFNYSLEIAGVVGVVATARPGVPLAKLERLIDEEIDRFAQEGPSEEELQRVKAKHEFDFLSGLERIGSFGGKADRLALYNTYLGSPDFIRQDYERYAKLERGDLRSAAESYLKKPRLAVSFVPELSSAPEGSEPDRSQPPEVRASSSFHPPKVHPLTLSNGLPLLVVELHQIPKVSAALMLRAGAVAEPRERSGLASMTAEMLDEGTTTRTALQIEAELERMGSLLSTWASREWSVVSLNTLRRRLEPSLELMAEVVVSPSFPAEELERLRKQRLDAILQDRANAGATAGRVVRKVVFGADHPYGWPVGGEEDSVKRIEGGELEHFYRAHYGADCACLILVGDVEPEEARGAAERGFSEWRGASAEGPSVQAVPPASSRVYLVDRPGAAQSEIRLALLAPERSTPDYHAIEVLMNILGGGFASRLNLNLREDKGYSYGAFSAVRYGRIQSLLLGIAPVATPVTKEAIQEMLSEFEALGSWSRPVTERELADARGTLVRGYAQRFETLAQVAGELAELEGYGLAPEELTRYTAGIQEVTLAQVEAAARKYLRTDQVSLVVVGDKTQVESGLRSLGLGPFVELDPEGQPVSGSED